MILNWAELKTRLAKYFEPRRKNPVSISNDNLLDETEKPMTVANVSAPIRMSINSVDVLGSLKVNGTEVSTGSAGATQLSELSDVSYSSGDLTITSLDKLVVGSFEIDSSGNITLNADSGNIYFYDGATALAQINSGGILAKTLVYFDAETANTFGDGSTGAINWTSNQKQKVTITGTGITCNFTNPTGPCNLVLKVIQGDGNDVIGTWDSDIKWVGGSAPTLSTASGAIDIISFYFDGTNYFGVASLNFS